MYKQVKGSFFKCACVCVGGGGGGGVIQVVSSILHQAFYFVVYIMDLVKLVCISKVSTKSLRTS